jgi:predicted nucleic acid-binding protein
MTLVFDTEPVMAYLLGGPGGARAGNLLAQVEEGRQEGAMSRVNLAEVSYLLARRETNAARAIVMGLQARGMRAVPCEPAWEDAARIKASHAALSLADAFAIATARALAADLVVGGDEALRAACASERVRLRRV